MIVTLLSETDYIKRWEETIIQRFQPVFQRDIAKIAKQAYKDVIKTYGLVMETKVTLSFKPNHALAMVIEISPAEGYTKDERRLIAYHAQNEGTIGPHDRLPVSIVVTVGDPVFDGLQRIEPARVEQIHLPKGWEHQGIPPQNFTYQLGEEILEYLLYYTPFSKTLRWHQVPSVATLYTLTDTWD